jgi:hypothetical protein
MQDALLEYEVHMINWQALATYARYVVYQLDFIDSEWADPAVVSNCAGIARDAMNTIIAKLTDLIEEEKKKAAAAAGPESIPLFPDISPTQDDVPCLKD